jgi:ABC-type transport system involved in multi-copper enzyme maturation permease subunit
MTIRSVSGDVSAWLQGPEGQALTGTMFNVETARRLFLEHPPVLSIYLLVALGTAPFFVILGAHDQFASDLGSGYFRYLCSRCSRWEIFLGRYLGTLSLLEGAYLLSALAAAIVSVMIDGYPATTALGYALQVFMIVFLYVAALSAVASFISVLAKSAMGSLFLGMIGYGSLLIALWTIDRAVGAGTLFAHMLPSAVKHNLVSLDPESAAVAIASLPVYTLAYAGLAWRRFKYMDL